jgi:hypothetical protein
MTAEWKTVTRLVPITKYYSERYNCLAVSLPSEHGMTDTLDDLQPNDDLFFDDDPININQVAKVKIEEPTISLKTIFCPPGKLQLLSSSNGGGLIDVIGSEMIQPPSLNYVNAINYAKAKYEGGNVYAKLLQNTEVENEEEVGNGLTIDMIDKIIRHVSVKADPRCKYYFDFDKLLSLVEGLLFDFFKDEHKHTLTPPPNEEELLLSYAKYLFSNYTGDEPDDNSGRMAKLQEMFNAIYYAGIAVYIVTNNPYAKRDSVNSKDRTRFIQLIQILFPKFDGDHLICSLTNANRNKGEIIKKIKDPSKLSMNINELFPNGGMKRTKPRKSKRRYKVSSAHTANKKKQRNSKRYKNKQPLD